MNSISKHLFILAVALFFSCKEKFDLPPVKQAAETGKLNIGMIKSRYKSGAVYKFSGDTNVYCVVTADEASGNLYKEVYVKDHSGGLHVKLIAPGGLFTGDSIRINLSGVLVNDNGGLVQIDSVDLSKNVVKLASGLVPQPQDVTLSQLAAGEQFQSCLVKISHVEFESKARSQPYANAATKAAIQYTVQDCSNSRVSLRTSGYAYFAGQNTPAGNGSMIAIVSRYNNNVQLLVRNPGELDMSGALCGPASNTVPAAGFYLNKDFNDNSVSSGGWSVQSVLGSVSWLTSSTGSTSSPYCQASNYKNGSNVACEAWLISPAMDLSNAVKPALSFKNAYKYTGPPLMVYVSIDYHGGDPAAASWVPLSFTSSAGSFVFTASGNIPLDLYKSDNTRLAFVYKGTSSAGSTWEIDDIVVKEN